MEDSSYALHQQLELKDSMKRSKKEMSAPNAPLLSLADRSQLYDADTLLDEHGKRLEKMRQAVDDALPASFTTTDRVGSVRMTSDTTDSVDYISVTSGYDIKAMQKDLLSAWKYQRYLRKDSLDMVNLKAALDAVAKEMDVEVTFSTREGIREHCQAVKEKYGKLILSCEKYLAHHESPSSIAGKARKAMAENLIKASVAEMDMLEDSAINCYDDAVKTHEGVTNVTAKWDDILHHGRIKVDQGDDKNAEVMMDIIRNSYDLSDKNSTDHEVITVIKEVHQIDECHHIIAMSNIAQMMGVPELAGGGQMNTRMTTMIYGGKAVYGCITTGMDVKDMHHSAYEDGKHARPGKGILDPHEEAMDAEHAEALMALPFLDYLCAVRYRDPKQLECEKTETAKGMVKGKVRTTAHLVGKHGFEMLPGEFNPPEGTVISSKLADQILDINEDELMVMMAGLLNQQERKNLADRLKSLKRWVNDHYEADDRSFKEAVRAATKSEKEPKPEFTEKLTPLMKLAKAIPEPKIDKVMFIEYMPAIEDTVEDFELSLSAKVSLAEGWEAVKVKLDDQLADLAAMNDSMNAFLERSKDDKDYGTRVAVKRFLLASQFQQEAYRKHVEQMARWAKALKDDNSDRTFDFTFKQLFTEACLIAQRSSNDVAFPEEVSKNARQRVVKRKVNTDLVDHAAIDLEKRYAKRVGHQSLHDLTERMDAMLVDKGSNSDEAEDYGEELARVVAIKDQPIFGPGAPVEFEKAKDRSGGERTYLVGHVTDMLHEYDKLVNALTLARDAYFRKQNKKPTGGLITGEGRMNLMDEAYATCMWEHEAFLDEKSEKFFDGDRIMAYVKALVESGRPLEKITLTDLTNVMLLEQIEIPMDLKEVAEKVGKERGTKRKFGVSVEDSPEFSIVAAGLAALTDAKTIADIDPAGMRQFYGQVIDACKKYLKKNEGGRSTYRKELIKVAMDICSREQQGIK